MSRFLLPKIECINCQHAYYPRIQKLSPCPQCGGNPFTKGPGSGWRKGIKGYKRGLVKSATRREAELRDSV